MSTKLFCHKIQTFGSRTNDPAYLISVKHLLVLHYAKLEPNGKTFAGVALC